MKINNYLVATLALFAILPACRQNSKLQRWDYQMVRAGVKEFKLDQYTSPVSINVTYLENDTLPLYIHFSYYNSTFHYYDYNNCRYIKSVSFKKFPMPYSAFYLNHDSVFFMYRGEKNQIIIADTTGKPLRIKTTDARIDDDQYINAEVTAEYLHPILVKGSKIFYSNILLTSFTKGSSSFRLGGWYDINSGERNNFISFPWFYFNSDWGHLKYPRLYHCFDETRMIVSFAASRYLYLYSLADGSPDSVLCESDYFSSIPPLGKKKEGPYFDNVQSVRHYVLNPSYFSVHYDKYREVYYRIAELPRSERDFDENNLAESCKKPLSIIIMDKKFKKIGETIIGNQYRMMCSVITPDGFLIQRHGLDEDKAVYDIFKLTHVTEKEHSD